MRKVILGKIEAIVVYEEGSPERLYVLPSTYHMKDIEVYELANEKMEAQLVDKGKWRGTWQLLT